MTVAQVLVRLNHDAPWAAFSKIKDRLTQKRARIVVGTILSQDSRVQNPEITVRKRNAHDTYRDVKSPDYSLDICSTRL